MGTGEVAGTGMETGNVDTSRGTGELGTGTGVGTGSETTTV